MKVQATSTAKLLLAVALGLMCALELVTSAGGFSLECTTSDKSPSVNDAIDAATLILSRGECCQSNEALFGGSHCYNFQSVGDADIGICGSEGNCFVCESAAEFYFLLIETCASNAFGGSRVAGSVKDMTSDWLWLELY